VGLIALCCLAFGVYMSEVERLAEDLQTGIQFGTLPRGVTH